jgi:hypothetical protein
MKEVPFTFSHAAAALVFPRRRLSFSALVVGAMAPDYLYFIQLSHSSRYGHTLPGMFLFSLPCGLVVLWLYHALLKRPLLSLAPDQIARRVTADDLNYRFWPARRFLMVALSVLLGVFTHVIWDAFTHESGLFVTVVPELKLYFGLHMPMYSVLQLGSSAVGALLLAWVYWRWCKKTRLRNEPVVPQLSLAARVVIFSVSLAAALAFALPYGWDVANHYPKEIWWSVFIVKSVIGGITATFIEIFAFSVAWHLRKEKVPELELGD